MGTSNFYYLNRCVVIEDEDIELENYPDLSNKPYDHNRMFPSYRLRQCEDDFKFWDIVMTYGYYEHACIDYRPKDIEIYDFVDPYYFSTQKELFDAICDVFDISRYRLKKIFGKLANKEITDYFEDKCDSFIEYLADKEKKDVDKRIDQIKSAYGYKEYGTIGRFYNGETIMEEIG